MGQPDEALERILDAAGVVIARRGDIDCSVAEVAAEAGCTRGTVHRYVGDRDGLRRAFVEREAARVAGRVARRIEGLAGPDALVGAVGGAVAEVRADPLLAAWFSTTSAGQTGRIAVQAGVIHALAGEFVSGLLAEAEAAGTLRPGVSGQAVVDTAVRLVLSLLVLPGDDAAAEERLVHGALVPQVYRR